MTGALALWALVGVGIAVAIAFVRLLAGPTNLDRLAALDLITTETAIAALLFCVVRGSLDFVDAALVVSVLGFFGLVVIARFLVKGVVIDERSE